MRHFTLAVVGIFTLACGVGPSRPPAGPGVSQRVDLPEQPLDVVMLGDGAAVIRTSQALVGVTPGVTAWTRDGSWGPWIGGGPDGAVIATDSETVQLLDPATGAALATLLFPVPKAEDTGSVAPVPIVYAGAKAGEVWVLVDDEARFWTVDFAGKSVRQAFQLPDEVVSTSRLLWHAPTDTLILEEYGLVRRFERDGTTVFAAYSHDSVGVDGTVLLDDGSVASLIDADLTVLGTGCKGEFAPSGWPHPGELYSKDLDEVPNMAKPASGCVTSQVYLEYADPVPPLVIGGALVVNGETTAMWKDGSKVWSSEAYGSGTPILSDDGSILLLGEGVSDSDPWQLISLDPTDGTPKWSTPVGKSAVPFIFDMDDLTLARSGKWVLTGYEGELAWVQLP